MRNAADVPSIRSEPHGVAIAVLGPMRVHATTGELHVGPPQRRTVLAVLVCAARQVIPTERILDCVWGDHAGPSALGSLHSHISKLRKTLGRPAIVRHSHGYQLTVPSELIDADRFSQLARWGRSLIAHGQLVQGRRQLREALSLWRGHPYEEFDHLSWVRSEIARLHSEHLGALIARIDADLEIGDTDVVGELEALALEQPHHDGLCARLMVALYRSGRQSDALCVYRRHADRLIEVSGLRPTPALEDLQLRILRHDPRLIQLRRSDTLD